MTNLQRGIFEDRREWPIARPASHDEQASAHDAQHDDRRQRGLPPPPIEVRPGEVHDRHEADHHRRNRGPQIEQEELDRQQRHQCVHESPVAAVGGRQKLDEPQRHQRGEQDQRLFERRHAPHQQAGQDRRANRREHRRARAEDLAGNLEDQHRAERGQTDVEQLRQQRRVAEQGVDRHHQICVGAVKQVLVARKDRNGAVPASDPHQPLADQVVGVIVPEQRAVTVAEFGDVVRRQGDGYPEAICGQKDTLEQALLTRARQSPRHPQPAFLDEQRPNQRWPALDDQRPQWRRDPHRAAPPPAAQLPDHRHRPILTTPSPSGRGLG